MKTLWACGCFFHRWGLNTMPQLPFTRSIIGQSHLMKFWWSNLFHITSPLLVRVTVISRHVLSLTRRTGIYGNNWSSDRQCRNPKKICARVMRSIKWDLSSAVMQSLISPVTKAILVALFIFAILLILYVILWYICRDVDCDHGIWCWMLKLWIRWRCQGDPGKTRYLSTYSNHCFCKLSSFGRFGTHYARI